MFSITSIKNATNLGSGKLQTFVSLIAKAFILSIGWSLIDDHSLQLLNEFDRSMIIFSHTSYADFYIMILYLLAYPYDLNHIRTLVKPQPFEYLGPLLRKLGAIPATKISDKNGGAVNRIIDELKTQDRFAFLISPKGTILKNEWRSGYYYIAQEFQANLRVGGLDYEQKCVKVSKHIEFNDDERLIEKFLKEQLSSIVPLYPEMEVVKIRPHSSDRISMVDWTKLLLISILPVYFSVLFILILLGISYNKLF